VDLNFFLFFLPLDQALLYLLLALVVHLLLLLIWIWI
jgi:hypothetical protein